MIFFKKLWCKIFGHKFIAGATSSQIITTDEEDYLYYQCFRCGFKKKSKYPDPWTAHCIKSTDRVLGTIAERLAQQDPWSDTK